MFLYIFSLFSSSFIEEEHQIWYFLEITQFYLVIFLGNNLINTTHLIPIVFLLLITRLTRMINQTGNKWIHLKDVGDILRELDSKLPLVICGGFALFVVGIIEKTKYDKSNNSKKVFLIFQMVAIFIYHFSTNLELFSL